jgi:hypothetical protein
MKRIALLIVVLSLTVVWGTHAQEIVTLTTPQVQTATSCTVVFVGLDLGNSRIVADVVLQPTGQRTQKVYDATTTPTGASLLHALNTGNFSVNSLMKAVYNRLSTDGVCAGTISGVPQD